MGRVYPMHQVTNEPVQGTSSSLQYRLLPKPKVDAPQPRRDRRNSKEKAVQTCCSQDGEGMWLAYWSLQKESWRIKEENKERDKQIALLWDEVCMLRKLLAEQDARGGAIKQRYASSSLRPLSPTLPVIPRGREGFSKYHPANIYSFTDQQGATAGHSRQPQPNHHRNLLPPLESQSSSYPHSTVGGPHPSAMPPHTPVPPQPETTPAHLPAPDPEVGVRWLPPRQLPPQPSDSSDSTNLPSSTGSPEDAPGITNHPSSTDSTDSNDSRESHAVVKHASCTGFNDSRESLAVFKHASSNDSNDPRESLAVVKHASCTGSNDSNVSLVVTKHASSTDSNDSRESLAVIKHASSNNSNDSRESLAVVKHASSNNSSDSPESLAVVKHASCTGSNDSNVSLVVTKHASSTDSNDSPESLAVVKHASCTGSNDSNVSLVVTKHACSTDSNDSRESLTVIKHASRNDSNDSRESLAVTKHASSNNSNVSHKTLAVVKHASCTDSNDSRESLAVVKQASCTDSNDSRESLAVVKQASCTDSNDSRESLAVVKHASSTDTNDSRESLAVVKHASCTDSNDSRESLAVVKHASSTDTNDSRESLAVVKHASCTDSNDSHVSLIVTKLASGTDSNDPSLNVTKHASCTDSNDSLESNISTDHPSQTESSDSPGSTDLSHSPDSPDSASRLSSAELPMTPCTQVSTALVSSALELVLQESESQQFLMSDTTGSEVKQDPSAGTETTGSGEYSRPAKEVSPYILSLPEELREHAQQKADILRARLKEALQGPKWEEWKRGELEKRRQREQREQEDGQHPPATQVSTTSRLATSVAERFNLTASQENNMAARGGLPAGGLPSTQPESSDGAQQNRSDGSDNTDSCPNCHQFIADYTDYPMPYRPDMPSTTMICANTEKVVDVKVSKKAEELSESEDYEGWKRSLIRSAGRRNRLPGDASESDDETWGEEKLRVKKELQPQNKEKEASRYMFAYVPVMRPYHHDVEAPVETKDLLVGMSREQRIEFLKREAEKKDEQLLTIKLDHDRSAKVAKARVLEQKMWDKKQRRQDSEERKSRAKYEKRRHIKKCKIEKARIQLKLKEEQLRYKDEKKRERERRELEQKAQKETEKKEKKRIEAERKKEKERMKQEEAERKHLKNEAKRKAEEVARREKEQQKILDKEIKRKEQDRKHKEKETRRQQTMAWFEESKRVSMFNKNTLDLWRLAAPATSSSDCKVNDEVPRRGNRQFPVIEAKSSTDATPRRADRDRTLEKKKQKRNGWMEQSEGAEEDKRPA